MHARPLEQLMYIRQYRERIFCELFFTQKRQRATLAMQDRYHHQAVLQVTQRRRVCDCD